MQKVITRRNMLKFAGGSAAGLLLTPIPWKTIDDIAIWSQNWSLIPKPLRGAIRVRYTTCSLCPAGCGVRARCVGNQPVGLSGVSLQPARRGTLCPVGLGAHHLPYHPVRLQQPVRQVHSNGTTQQVAVSLDDALGAISATMAGPSAGSVAILDQRPGRTISQVYRQFLASVKNGVYLVPPRRAGGLEVFEDLADGPWGQVGIDLENTGTILSFGAPILDGWGAPDRVIRLTKGRRSGDAGPHLRIIQAETRHSPTAALADSWLPLRPGTELALALGIAHVLIRENLVDEGALRRQCTDFEKPEHSSYLDLIAEYTPEVVSSVTGISQEQIRATARDLSKNRPSIVVGGGDSGSGPLGRPEEMAIAGLNQVLGAVGRPGGFVMRRPVPEVELAGGRVPAAATEIAKVPDHSVSLLILDAAESGSSIPWGLLEKKLVSRDALVVSLSPYATGLSSHADLIVPGPAFLECFEEAPTPSDAAAASYAISVPLLPAPSGSTEPLTFVRRIAAASGVPLSGEAGTMNTEEMLKRRTAAIHGSGRGKVFRYSGGTPAEVAGIDSPDSLWKMLIDGARWCDEAAAAETEPRFSLLGKDGAGFRQFKALARGRLALDPSMAASYPLILIPFGWRGSAASSQVSPVLAKLFRESNTKESADSVAVNPETGKTHGLSDHSLALVETASGSVRVEIHFDPAAMPGVLLAAVGPDPSALGRPAQDHRAGILSLCRLDDDSTWRVTWATVREA